MNISLPPSTPPFQSASKLPFEATPVKPGPYIALKELLAVKVHRLAGLALDPTAVEPDQFWTETLENADSYEAAQLSPVDLKILGMQYSKLAALKETPKPTESQSYVPSKKKKTPKPLESQSYVPTTIIMNVLSLAEAKAHPLPNHQVVGWFLNPRQSLFGDPFAKSLKPDIVAYLVPRKTAEEYLEHLQSKITVSSLEDLRPAWAQVISAAELKVSADGQPQLLDYLEAICCYRPDLVSVAAISAKIGGYQFYSLNAVRCLKYSDILQWKHKNTPSLQKFIAAVYQTQISRYEKMNYLENSLQAWSLEGGSESVRRWDMLPCFAGHYPGRGTWVACAIETTEATNLSPVPKLNIVKICWADAGSKSDEGKLYQDAHGDVKIPGLACIVDHWKTGKVVSGRRKPGGRVTKREQVCVILGSAGRPLNECKNVNQILGCIFDLLETLRVMCHRDVIHRDISWGNVMINPTPTDSVAGPVVGRSEQLPLYISELLGKEMRGSLSLLTDLDCSAKLQGLKEDAKTGRHWRTGTPMFIAMEISSNRVRMGGRPFPFTEFKSYYTGMLSSNHSCSYFQSLGQKVKEQLAHVSAHYREQPLWDLDTAPASKPKQEPPLVHTPRHDAESVFWLLWFLLARANPELEAPVEKDSAEKSIYDNFCLTMLNHTVGRPTDTREPLAAMPIEQYRQTLHPRFAQLGDMLYYMGHYFLIDPKAWSDYTEDSLGHAHYFMEFLLLGEILRNGELGDLSLDTTQPRPATDPMAPVRQSDLSLDSRGSYNYAASLTQFNADPHSVSSSGSKRKPDTDPEDSPDPKRRCAVPVQPRRSGRIRSGLDRAALAGAPQTGVQPEIVQPERNPFVPTPDRAEATEEDEDSRPTEEDEDSRPTEEDEDGRPTEEDEDGRPTEEDENGRPTEDDNDFLDSDVEQANYVASQESPKTKETLELKMFNQYNSTLVQALNAANENQVSRLRAEQWFTLVTK